MENLRKYGVDNRYYIDNLESVIDKCPQCCHRSIDLRATRPADPDVSLGQEDDSDIMMGGDDIDQDSDDEHDPSVMAICIPPQSLRVR